MIIVRRLALGLALLADPGWAGPSSEEVIALDTRLALELVRHTPTYTPPVASRALAHLWIAGFEAVAGGSDDLRSLAGQLNGLTPPPAREAGQPYDEAAVLQATLERMLHHLFRNTGPSGQRALAGVSTRLADGVAEGVEPAILARSRIHGAAVADHVIAWGETDGGEAVENMGFPMRFDLSDRPGAWAPTSRIVQQQSPLLPAWGENRPFAMPKATTCPLAAPPAFSEAPSSPFMAEAREVLEMRRALSPEQAAMARFWADDAMLSFTPPGHWIALAAQELDIEGADAERRLEVLARLSIAMADAFIGCWHEKFRWNLVRPVTVIRATLDPAFDPLIITPPFPEYPSGHSVQSAAAAAVLDAAFGPGHAFTDRTHDDDGLEARSFPSFQAAAEEAALSRLYGGIHFRSAVEQGLLMGACIGAHAAALDTGR